MKTFRVITSEVVYYEYIVEAENEDAAIDKVWQGEESGATMNVDGWQIDSVKDISEGNENE